MRLFKPLTQQAGILQLVARKQFVQPCVGQPGEGQRHQLGEVALVLVAGIQSLGQHRQSGGVVIARAAEYLLDEQQTPRRAHGARCGGDFL